LNADFDGDCCNVSIAVDNKMADFWYSLNPEFNIFALDEPGKVSRNIQIAKPIIASVSSWLNG
jgi:hypothetical protein